MKGEMQADRRKKDGKRDFKDWFWTHSCKVKMPVSSYYKGDRFIDWILIGDDMII